MKLCCIAALCVFAASLSGCGKGGKLAVAGKEPITNVVKVENAREALKTWTVNRARADLLILIDPSDEMAAFPEKIVGEVQNAAGHLKRGNEKVIDLIAPWIDTGGSVNLGYMAGMYRKVVWVVPSALPVADRPVNDFVSYLATRRGIPREALREFARNGRNITGSVAGIPVTITRFADLALDKKTSAIIHINLAYFPAMKAEDPKYRTGTNSLVSFLKELREKNVRTPVVTVDLASRTGLIGVDIRFFGDVIKEALFDPRTLSGPLPDKWERMAQAEDSLVAKRYAGAAVIYEELAKGYTQDAGSQFSLAIAHGLAGSGVGARTAVVNAYRLDPEYLRGFFQLANVLAANGQVAAGLEILNSPDLASIYPAEQIDYQKGLFYYTAHRPKDALPYLGSAAQRMPKDFNLFVMIYKAQKELGDVAGRIYAVEAILDLDEERLKREAPWILADAGQLAEKLNYLGSANKMYEKYVQAVPDDSLAAVFKKKMAEWKAKNIIKTEPPQWTITPGGS